MAVPISVLMCHAPIVVPAVGGARGPDCIATTNAMHVVARRLVAKAPDALIVISPHTPRRRDRITVVGRVRGDLASFGAPAAQVDLPDAPDVRAQLHAVAGAAVVELDHRPLDHGAMVPLWFVVHAGWSGPTLVVGLPSDDDGVPLGHALRDLIERTGQRVAVLASGDMSHRLIPGAPAGYDPRARAFDDAFVRCVRAGDLGALSDMDPALRSLAAEDAVASTLAAGAAVGWRTDHHEVVHYEGPFGVGYCEAVLFAEDA